MSSTARGGQRSPADYYGTPAWGTYHLVSALRRYVGFQTLRQGMDAPLRILEPCAGRGAIVTAFHELLKFYEPEIEQEWTAVEMEPHGDIIGKMVLEGGHSLRFFPQTDFFTYAKGRPTRWANAEQTVRNWPFDLVVMNPPFRYALEFIQNCMRLAPVVIALERLNFFGSDDRADFMRMSKPSVFVMPNRMSFHDLPEDHACSCVIGILPRSDCDTCNGTGIIKGLRVGATDSIEYGWFAWGLGSVNHALDGIVRVMPKLPKELREPSREFKLNPLPAQWAAYMATSNYDLAI